MHGVVSTIEVEPGFILPVYDPTHLAQNKAQLSRMRHPQANTLLRYCRYSSRTMHFLGLALTQHLSDQIFKRVSSHLDAVVTPYTLGLVERKYVDTSVVDSKIMALPAHLNEYALVQEVDIVRPSLNIALYIRNKSRLKPKMHDVNPYDMVVDGFQWTDGSSSQYRFGTTAAERERSIGPMFHQVDMEYYIDPTLHFLADTGLVKEW